MSALATPILYRNITLPYNDDDDTEWSRITALANSERLSEGHVRSINIGAANFTKQAICSNLGLLIRKLPKDTLQRFHHSPLVRLSHGDLKILWKNQKQLKNLVFDLSLNSPSTSDIISEDMGMFVSLKLVCELEIDFAVLSYSDVSNTFSNTNSQHWVFFSFMMSALPNLRSIVLKFIPYSMDEGRLSRCLSRSLTHISLWYTDFEDINAEYLPLDQFPALTFLELRECDLPSVVLKAFAAPALKSFAYHHHCREQGADEETLNAVIDFLNRSRPLQRLIIDCAGCLETAESKLASSITAHASSLEFLLVTCENVFDTMQAENSLPEAIGRCRALKQLGLSFTQNGLLETIEDYVVS